jgi:hypothetical protein
MEEISWITGNEFEQPADRPSGYVSTGFPCLNQLTGHAKERAEHGLAYSERLGAERLDLRSTPRARLRNCVDMSHGKRLAALPASQAGEHCLTKA